MPRHTRSAFDSARRTAALRASSGVDRGPEGAEDAVGRKGRKALKGVVVYLSPPAKDVLVRIARSRNKTVQELGAEAMNLLFVHYGEKPIC